MRSIYLLRSMRTSRVCLLYRSSRRYHRKRWKSEMMQTYLENTWLDGRNAANSVQIRGWTSDMLQTACKTEGLGHHLGTHTMGGGPGSRITGIYIYICIHDYICVYVYIYIHMYLSQQFTTYKRVITILQVEPHRKPIAVFAGRSLSHHHSTLGTCTAARPAELPAGLGAVSRRVVVGFGIHKMSEWVSNSQGSIMDSYGSYVSQHIMIHISMCVYIYIHT